MDVPAIELRDVHLSLGGRPVLRGVSLRVARGELLAIVGESGSGKTSLLSCVNRLYAPERGEVLVRGRPVRTVSPEALRRSIGYVVQKSGLLPHWDVCRNAGTVLELLGVPLPERTARVRELLALVGVPEPLWNRRPRELSGGQAQRVALARALAARPDILLLDEPLGALDPIARGQLRASLGGVLRSNAMTALLVTHDLAEAKAFAGRLAVMEQGRLVQEGTAEALRGAPATPFVEALFREDHPSGLPSGRGAP
ncbi:MAG: ATP-binding cassette domain-containing protein [Myxococcales bacterium]